MLDDVHGSHSESCSVNQAADVTTDIDVVKVERVSDTFLVVILAGVLFALDLGLSEHSVIVNGDLGVSSDDGTILGDNEGVDLDQIAVLFYEAVKDMFEQEYYLALVLLNTKILSRKQEILNIWAFIDVNVNLEDLLRV